MLSVIFDTSTNVRRHFLKYSQSHQRIQRENKYSCRFQIMKRRKYTGASHLHGTIVRDGERDLLHGETRHLVIEAKSIDA